MSNDSWVVKVGKDQYASEHYFRNGMSGHAPGRPLVKNREKALVMTTEETRSDGILYRVLREMNSRGVKMSVIRVAASDHREDFLGLAGWWDLIGQFPRK